MIGRVLGGRYEILKAIDSGGMAYVFKAFCRKTNSYVAVKILKEKFCTSAEYVKRFKKEAEAAFSLEHDNIVRVRDLGCDDGDYYMVMDYIEGTTLKTLIEQKGTIGEKDAVLIAIQICSALSAAHKRGIIHRDIKPQNILIDTQQNAKLTDFGIAKSVNTTKQEIEKQVIGSVHYISPGQARGDLVDARTDIYSLGILLYEMLTGELPHTGEQTVSVALKHINEQLTPPSQINPVLSESVSKIVLKATGKNRKERYRSADAFKQDLMRALVDPRGDFVDIPDMQQKRTGARPQATRKQKTLKICILILLTGVLVAGALIGISMFLDSDQKLLSVPDMTGQDEEYAVTMLERSGFLVERFYEFSETAEEGRVISQTPEPGATGVRGETVVTLTVSAGPADLIMPDLYGRPLEEALAFIQEMGLVLDEIVYEPNDDIPSGTVISQIPAADSVIPDGDIVTLYVSGEQAPPGTAMPQLSGMTVQQAVRQLNDMGFMACFVYEEESTAPEGTVIEQSSMQGVQTPLSAKIDLWISAYSEKPYIGYLYVHLDIPDRESRVRIVLETQIEGVPVNFVVHETQVAQEGLYPVYKDIRCLSGDTKTARIYVNNIEVSESEVVFVKQ